jgi:SseB protein N-terminal domain
MTGRALVPSSGDFADDDGTADPRLEAALARVNGSEEVSAALLDARLLVPILATPLSAEHGADLALVTVIGRDGQRALPAFTSLDTLVRWRTDARPVPVRASGAAAATYDEEAVALVLDIAGPIPHTISGSRLAALAEGRAWQPAYADGQVATVVRGHLLALAGATVRAHIRPSEHTDAMVLLVPDAGLDPPRVEGIARDLAARLAADSVLRARLDAGLDLAVVGSAEQVVQRGVDELR